jgi:hypothetical protein
MDDFFEKFQREFGEAIDRRDVPASTIERYRGKLPDKLLSYWEEHGWCGYADGLFWTVDPQDYEPALEAWIGDTQFMEDDAYHVIARSAFGAIYFWGERNGFAFKLFAPGSYAVERERKSSSLDRQIQTFFALRTRKENDFDGMFAGALKKIGRLRYDEMYGFVPALALGGAATLESLERVKVVEHLVLLAQIESLEIMSVPPD